MEERHPGPAAAAPDAARAKGMQRNALVALAGVVASGAGIYVFLSLAARTLEPAAYSALSAFWALVNLLGVGFFQPLESELARALSALHTGGRGTGPTVRWGVRTGVVAAAALALVLLAASFVLVPDVFKGDWSMLPVVMASCFAFAGVYVTWGVSAGLDRFGSYAKLLWLQAGTLVAAAIVLAAAGAGAAALFAAAFTGAQLLATAVSFPRGGDPRPAPAFDSRRHLLAAGKLVIASAASQILFNAGPIVIQFLSTPEEAESAGAFLSGLVLARVPTFLYGAVLAALLPQLTSYTTRGDRKGFTRLVMRLGTGIAGLGALSLVFVAVAGPWLTAFLFGERYRMDLGSMMALVGGSIAYLFAVTFGQALVALDRHARVATGWAAGCAAFFAVVALPAPLDVRAERGYLVGMAVAAVVMVVELVVSIRSATHFDVSELVRAEGALAPEP